MKMYLLDRCVWIYYQKAWGLWQNMAVHSRGISITSINHHLWPTRSVEQHLQRVPCLCLYFPFLLVTIIIVLSGLVTMHRVQGQSISRIHTHQATSLSLLCLCHRCKKGLQVSSCLDSHIQPQWSLFTGLCSNVSLCCRKQLQQLDHHWSLKGKEQPTS